MSSSFKQDKPEDCIVCTEKLGEEEKVLDCGHWVHLLCIQKHFKPECPICRKPLNITVNGTIPRPEENNDIDNNHIDNNHIDNNDIQEININIHIHGINIPNVVERGFTYEINNIIFIEEHYYEDENDENSRDDDSDSDEENPRGDNFDYDDY
jgi:hypothetical protein